MEYTYEKFLAAMRDTIKYSLEIRGDELEAYLGVEDVPMKKIPEEIQNAWSKLIDSAMSDTLEAIGVLENVEECLDKILYGNPPQEVTDLMQEYYEAVKKMYEAEQNGDTISKNKAQYEMEALEDSMGYEGYFIIGGYEAFSNMAMEAEFSEAE